MGRVDNNLKLCHQFFPGLSWRTVVKDQHYAAKLLPPLDWLEVSLVVTAQGSVARFMSETQLFARSDDRVDDTAAIALEQLRLKMSAMLFSFQHALEPKYDHL